MIIFNTLDILGRLVASKWNIGLKTLIILPVIRIALDPSTTTDSDDYIWGQDTLTIFNLSTLAFSNGYLTTQCFVFSLT